MTENTNLQTNGDDAKKIIVSTETETRTIEPPIMLLFGEYLGFVSDLIDFAEEWCKKPKSIQEWKKKAITIDALNIYHKMQSMADKFPKDAIIKYYDEFYDIALKDWVNKLNSIEIIIK